MFLHVHALPTFETWPVASWQASLIANFYVSNIFGKHKQKTKSVLFTERTRRDAHYLRAFLHSPPPPLSPELLLLLRAFSWHEIGMLFVWTRPRHMAYILVLEYRTNPLGLILYENMPENVCLSRNPTSDSLRSVCTPEPSERLMKFRACEVQTKISVYHAANCNFFIPV